MRFLASLFLCLQFGLWAQFLQAAPQQVQHATVELIAEQAVVRPGDAFTIALRYELDDHWHLYWENPGASGFPPSVEWDLPEGVEVGALQFPAPERFELAGLVSYGHEGVVLFPMQVTVASDYAGERLRLKGQASWLLCKDVCIADDAELSLDLSVGDTGTLSKSAASIQAAVSALPEPFEGQLESAIEGKEFVLKVRSAEVWSEADVYFYSLPEGLVDPNAAQDVEWTGAAVEIRVALSDYADGIEDFGGVLQVGERRFELPMGLIGAVSGSLSNSAVSGTADSGAIGFEERLLQLGPVGWLILAFVGGLILNFMPCVLPVLSLKVFSLLKHTGQSRREAMAHGLAYTAGVVLSFIALAGVLFALRAAGELIGWGYQLQSPGFTLGLTVLFFVFGLNLMGVFEIGVGLVGADAKVSQRNDLIGSLGMGVLAAVVGAPCMGPLVASVSGIAIQASIFEGLLIFGTMGLGLASPFLLLAIFPKFAAFLPKPGAWMETFKQVMGFLLMLAVIFLAGVVGRSGGIPAMMTLLIVLFLSALGAWIYGRWGAPVKTPGTRRIALGLALLLIVGGGAYGAKSIKQAYLDNVGEHQLDGAWATWSPERVEQELEAGNAVFVDFTASWCLICQANKIPLRSDEIEMLFEDEGIVSLEADWTLRDSVIAQVLEQYGRAGVPLYLLYTPDGEVVELPQNLTRGIIRSAVEDAL
ncbi:protein-disulfide reductase DsbD family protein [Coraliomargarita akajimensis]|uniref:Cytochrome c biogenesis protein transmembrane region n=1 Tax=Coraliomargarita akajimensis (strain DSM 45221 / IAM 15411 / JCM 23193 / KCTC 12865 / 04OKA010-24) TaxID=583355 RepID=D5EM22_CORAD|nr:protein-disulfide reductase DsbD domain-containing protein [Coraliomargarita akajimensis]ADE55182.1 cytochrome c biogenesis protein transmembrane region [Coraliomargarita akajimensis DSM 45221]